jgi:hypothetical protein
VSRLAWVFASIAASTAGVAGGCSNDDSSSSPPDEAGAADVTGAGQNAEASAAADGGGEAGRGTGPGDLIWFIGGPTLQLLTATDGGAAIVEAYFDRPNTYVFVTKNTLASAPPNSAPAMTFTAVDSFDSTCDGGARITGLVESVEAGLPPRVKAVLYDNESWCFTPQAERSDPQTMGVAQGEAATATRSVGAAVLAAPAQDIVRDMGPFDGSIQDRFLALELPGIAAKNADVYEVQSQGLQNNAALFESFLAAAASNARSANPNVKVLGGLSTNPANGLVPTSFELCQLVVQTRDIVDGFWLNVPRQGAFCPTCSADPHPDVAINLLLQLQAAHCDPAVTP